jgi:hypothetical protein
MAYLDAALMQEVLDVTQREPVADIEHHREAVGMGGWSSSSERRLACKNATLTHCVAEAQVFWQALRSSWQTPIGCQAVHDQRQR